MKVTDYHFLKKYKLLCVDDDIVTLKYLEASLSIFFKQVITASNGEEANNKLRTVSVDIILTDLYMPNEDGILFIENLRKHNLNVPVVFLSACSDIASLLKVIPLHASAYLLKPVGVEQILKKLAEIMQKREEANNNDVCLYQIQGEIVLNVENKSVEKQGKPILLSKKEFDLLELLAKNNKSILSKDFIEEHLWREPIASSSVKTLIKKLRVKIGEDSIATITNIGYKIVLSN